MTKDKVATFIEKQNNNKHTRKTKKTSSVFLLKKGQKDKKILLPHRTMDDIMGNKKDEALNKFNKKYIEY